MKTISQPLAKRIHDIAEKKGYELVESKYSYAFKPSHKGFIYELTTTKIAKKYEKAYKISIPLKAFQTDELLDIVPAAVYRRDRKYYVAYRSESMYLNREYIEKVDNLT